MNTCTHLITGALGLALDSFMELAAAFPRVFQVRRLRLAIIPQADDDGSGSGFPRGNKRRLYTLIMIAFLQPVFMWWLTRYIAPSYTGE